MLRNNIYPRIVIKLKSLMAAIVLDPCKAGQIYENRLGLNNFTAKWEKGEPLVLKNVWQYCRKASGRDKQQPAESTT